MAKMLKQYYRWHWEEPRGDQYNHWGASDWYVEIGDDGYVSKQMELYASGDSLYYSENHIEDSYGMLSEGLFELLDAGEVQITKTEFYKILNTTKFNNVEKTI
jgi:hypothetical protein